MTEQMKAIAFPRDEDGGFVISFDTIPLIPKEVIEEWYQDTFPELSYTSLEDKIAHIQALMFYTDAENDIKSDFNQYLHRHIS